MEMKINFNKIFEASDSDSHTPSTTSLQNSYNFDEPSVMSHTSNHINLHYKLNQALFFDSQATMQNDQQINILGDLSSIGRSFEDSFEKQSPIKLAQKSLKTIKQTPKLSKIKSDEQYFTKQTFGVGQKTLKTPGQRLYYEHKINQERKQREAERLKIEKQEQQKKQITFKPAINQNSRKILQLADSPLRKLKNFKKNLKLQQTQQEIKSTAQKKYQEDLKNCTFQPTLTKTPKNKFTMNSLNQKRNRDQVFQELYKDHKLKEMKRKETELQLSKRQKKMTQEQLDEFLSRHQEYLQQKLHKQEVMRAVSSQYDLSSGRKLFQPKINETSEPLVSSASCKKIVSSTSSKKFIVHQESYEDHESNYDISEKKKSSGKSKRGKSTSKYEQTAIKKQNEGSLIKGKDSSKNNNNSFQLLPYQVTRMQKEADKANNQYQRPLSTIFSKMKDAEEVFEEKNQQDEDQLKKSQKSFKGLSQEDYQKDKLIEDSQNELKEYDIHQDSPVRDDQQTNVQLKEDQDEDYQGIDQENMVRLESRDEVKYHQRNEVKYQQVKSEEVDGGQNFEDFKQRPEREQWKGSLFEENKYQNLQQGEGSYKDKQPQWKYQEIDTVNKYEDQDQYMQKMSQPQDQIYIQGGDYRVKSYQESEQKVYQHVVTIETCKEFNKIYSEHGQDDNHLEYKQPQESYMESRMNARETYSQEEMGQIQLNIEAVHTNFNLINGGLELDDETEKLLTQSLVKDHHQQIVFESVIVTDQKLQTPIILTEQPQIEIIPKSQQIPKKNWQDIFNSSLSLQRQDQQISHSTRLKTTNLELQQSSVTLHNEQSPKKKPINIASLLKGKKKHPVKTEII